tara:strand:- start:1565 stop:2752 length:1188 start_codon:yes stop_codon:yes gene_type:complete
MSHPIAGKWQGSAGDGAIAAFEQLISPQKKRRLLRDAPPEGLFPSRNASPDTGIIIVNWNSWAETIEALEAVFRMQDFDGPVVVCDNASSDNSLAHIRQWAEGKLCALPESRALEIRSLVVPPVAKDFRHSLVSCAQIENFDLDEGALETRLWLVNCAENLGFGAGSNVGIRLLQRMPSIQNFWLLNADALPEHRAYRELKNEIPQLRKPVICGSVLMEYWKPSEVQSCGARFNPLLCSMSDNYKGISNTQLRRMDNIYHVDYPVGASLVVNREFLDRVGLMCEDYFLYFEELDWVMRSGWPSRAFVVTSSRVYHKGGSTTGAGTGGYRNRPLVADYYFLRSRILFARKSGLLGAVIAAGASVYALLKRSLMCDRSAFSNAFKASVDGFRSNTGR